MPTAPITITATACTSFGDHWEHDTFSLAHDVFTKALDAARLFPTDLDGLLVAQSLAPVLAHDYTLPQQLGRTLHPTLPVAGWYGDSVCSSDALAHACLLLNTTTAQRIAICAVEKMTDWDDSQIQQALQAHLPADEQHAGLTLAAGYGLVAATYLEHYATDPAQLAEITTYHHQQASGKPGAQFPFPIAKEKVTASRMLAEPICELHASAPADGACAIILEKQVDNILSKKTGTTLLRSVATAYDAPLAQREELTTFAATKQATECLLAGKSFPTAEEIPVWEVDDSFAIGEILALEGIGLALPGTTLANYTAIHNKYHINTSGGLKAFGHPLTASGLRQVISVQELLQQNRQHHWGATHLIGGVGYRAGMCLLEHLPAS